MPTSDIAIITVIPEEYAAITTRLETEGCQLRHFAGTRRNPNRFAWLTGELANADGQPFQIVVALAATPGPTQMATVVSATIARHKPRYVLLVGIAGGFPKDGLTRGDVAVSTVVYDFEYGKVARDLSATTRQNESRGVPRYYRAHSAFDTRDQLWKCQDEHLHRATIRAVRSFFPASLRLAVRSSTTLRTLSLAQVFKAWPGMLAVEMEASRMLSGDP